MNRKPHWKRERVSGTLAHIYFDEHGEMMGFVREQGSPFYIDHWFARAYVPEHYNGFFVKTLAEGKAIVEDALARGR